jgi:hypothetical protein
MLGDVGAMGRWRVCAFAFAFVVACGRRPPDAVALEPALTGAPGLATSSSAAPAGSASETLALRIPPRAHAPEAPPEGWCGETAIQEGLLSLGVWAPQRLINKAGKPVHPDLYSSDLPVALSDLGVRYSFYGGGKGFEAFARWVGKAVDEGDPVLAGVKILPTQHPEWGLDHFVLVVGHGDGGLLVNTTWGSRRWVSDTTTPGLSFKNAFYAIRLVGIALPPKARAARLTVLDEDASTVKVRVSCAGLQTGASYRMERRSARTDDKALWSEELVADRERVEKDLSVDANRPARFHCVVP